MQSGIISAGIQNNIISVEQLLSTRSTFSKSVRVSVAISMLESSDPGVKINEAHHHDVLLRQTSSVIHS